MESNRSNTPLLIKFEEHKVPEFKEEKNKEWITYGLDSKWRNRYPEYLLSLFNKSVKHNAIVTSKANYIAGNGFEIVGKPSLEDRSFAEEMLRQSVNKYGEGYGDIGYKCALDVEVFGGCYLEIIWDKKGKDFEVYHMNYCDLRISKDETHYLWSNDWSKSNQNAETTGLKEIPLFDPENPKGSQIYAYKEYRPNLKYYPLPNYVGAIMWCEIDHFIANYHHSDLSTGFMAGTMINFANGKPTNEERKEIEQKIKDKFTGTDKAGSILLTFSQNKDNAPTIQRIADGKMHDSVITLNKESVISELIIGHRINSGSIFGVPQPAGLGSERSQMMTAYELFKNTYATPKQRSLNIYFNVLLKAKGLSVNVKLKESPPLEANFSESLLEKIMTKNELRKMMGLKPIEGYDAPQVEPKKEAAPKKKAVKKQK